MWIEMWQDDEHPEHLTVKIAGCKHVFHFSVDPKWEDDARIDLTIEKGDSAETIFSEKLVPQ